VTIAVLGPGGVGGLVAGALDHAGDRAIVVARESTARLIGERGLRVSSVRLGELTGHPRAVAELREPVDALVVATKAIGLEGALERIAVEPPLVLPLLNGVDHVAQLRERFAPESVLAGSIRVEADRPEPGVVVHTSPFLRVDMASRYASGPAAVEDLAPRMRKLAARLEAAGIPARVRDSEPQVLWSKLVRLNALACTTSAFDKLLGEIRDTPQLRAALVGAIEEGCAVANAEGARLDASDPLGELNDAHATLGSSMQRDIAAGRTPELDAIPGAVLRAAARRGLACPTIEGLVARIAERAGVTAPVVAG
jgi:2-dehydropantoate 2-reductase